MAVSLIDQISPEYGLVLLVSVILGFECVLFGFLFPGRLRRKTFNKDFLKDKFGKEHGSSLQAEIQVGGYPDMGNGRYSQQLSYKDWYLFNCAQRVHLNFVESIATYLILLLVAGLYNPVVAAILGVFLIVGRLIYGIGYMYSPTLRAPGAIICDIALLALTGLAGYGAFTIVRKGKWL